MRKACVRGVVVYDEKVLFVQQGGNSFWCLPGGKIEEHESVEDAFKREMIEELGIEPQIGELMHVHQYVEADGSDFIEFFFRVKNPQDYLEIDLTKTTHGELELDAIKFINPRVEDVLPKFLATEADEYILGSFDFPRFRSEI